MGCFCRQQHQVIIMKDSVVNNSTASISHARKAVEQLKMEACMDRIKVKKKQ
uniref:G protein gamma domain-containing protein n=1 Tax=Hucho hucho TaxID=62062 RepID=A0A4W5KF67_9TELE